MSLKYITYEHVDGTYRCLIGDKLTTHAELARHAGVFRILGAGETSMELNNCYGRSVSLNVASREDDDLNLIRSLYNI